MTGTLASRALRYLEAVAAADWDALPPLVAADGFLLVGRTKQELDWPATLAAIRTWAHDAAFDYDLLRIEETGRLVFVELSERTRGKSLDTLTVFEFDDSGLLRRMDCFE